jgi:arylamine N-acetyltransferase
MNEWTARYLKLVGLEPASPSLDWLRRFGEAHLRAVPFTNVTSVLRRHASTGETVPPLDVDALLDVWEQRTGGGVCFETAGMVFRLLRELGYDVHQVLGEITFPGSHQAVAARLREGPFLVDLGCGAPLPEPIPLLRDSEYHAAGLGYRFRPDLGTMTCVQDRLIDGAWTAHCRYDLRPASEEACDAAYQRHHIPGETWVLGTFTLVRYLGSEVIALREGRVTHYAADSKHSIELATHGEYERYFREDLGWPELPIAEALVALEALQPPV